MTNKERAAEVAAEQDLGIIPNAETVFGGKLLKLFEDLVESREALRVLEKTAKEDRGYTADSGPNKGKRVPGIDDRIKDMLADLKAVLMPDGSKVQVVEKQGNEYIDKELLKIALVEHGVPAEVVANCTRRGASSWYILVTPAKPLR